MINVKFKNYPITKKITHIYLPLSIIPLLIVATIFSSLYKKRVEETSFKNVMDNSKLIINRIEEILNATNDCSNMLIINLNTVIDKYSDENPSEFHVDLDINRELYNAKIIFSHADSILFINNEGKTYSTDPQLITSINQTVDNTSIRELIEGSGGQSTWINIFPSEEIIPLYNKQVFTMLKKVIHIKSGKSLGYLLVNVSEDSFSSMFEDQTIEYILVNDNKIISSKDVTLLNSEIDLAITSIIAEKNMSVITEINGLKHLIVVIPLGFNQWSLIGRVNLNLLTKDLSKMTMLIILIVLISITIQIIGAKLLSNLIAKPVNKAREKMKLIGKGNFNVHFDVEGNDEIGMFLTTFNKMAIKIKNLLLQVEEKEKLKREYELALIQQQIKPHFLYNTLNVIYMLCEMNMKKEALNATKSLADFYKGTLSNGREIITIEEELSALEDYLYIQMLKYSDVFKYTLEVDNAVLKYNIMKLTLQPLVENAIYHGLKPMGTMGQLKIQAKIINNTIELIVEDNGVGMDKRIYSSINDIHTAKTKEHFGLLSVKDRIHLYFGEKASFEIISEKNKGTKVIILLPIAKGRLDID